MSARQQRYGCEQLGVCQGRQPGCTPQCPGPGPAEDIQQDSLLSGLRFGLDGPKLSAMVAARRSEYAEHNRQQARARRWQRLQDYSFGIATGMALTAALILLGSWV